ncbi:TPA: hypothetical protein ACH3X2_013356 [Trebouxia sp. C0005]
MEQGKAEVIATCRELGIAIVPYSPLGRGFLTGNIRSLKKQKSDVRFKISPRFQGENLEKVTKPRAKGQVKQYAEQRIAELQDLTAASLGVPTHEP